MMAKLDKLISLSINTIAAQGLPDGFRRVVYRLEFDNPKRGKWAAEDVIDYDKPNVLSVSSLLRNLADNIDIGPKLRGENHDRLRNR